MRIIDLYPNDEIVLRIYNDPEDMTNYEEMKITVEEHGKYTETIRLKRESKAKRA